jgi:primosomal protein N' (replication factor Y)
MVQRVSIGMRVRINLNGRRVGGWIIDLAPHGDRDTHLALDRLASIISVSGAGVEAHLVPLAQWVALEWFGPWRAVLSSASAPRMREKNAHENRGKSPSLPNDEIAQIVRGIANDGGGLVVVPPLVSALNVVASLTAEGSVLVICPTLRMAILGAAALRRRGLTTALVPDDWENARAGVDVVIGARSAVYAPCNNLSSIVVIDEHDESLHEERTPTWDAVSVARQRAEIEHVSLILTSAVPSARALVEWADSTTYVEAQPAWPPIEVVDLADVPVAGSLLSSSMLQSVGSRGTTTLCVLNTKGKARLIVCKSCRAVQACVDCSALLTQTEHGELFCVRCQKERGSVCVSCGRSSFAVPRGGVTQLRSQLEASSPNPIVEITADGDDSWTKGCVFIGTEAVLYRIPSADCVVFADIDRDLGAPRLSAPAEVLALVARAARIVGSKGRIVIQTRQPNHPLMKAFSSVDIGAAIRAIAESELAQRQLFVMPPFARVVRITLSDGKNISDIEFASNVDVARDGDSFLLRSVSRDAIAEAVSTVKATFGTAVRVHADPRRF